MRSVVATWRLTRAVLHLVHGAAIIRLQFARYASERREARIAWWSAKLLRLLGLKLVIKGDVGPAQQGVLVVCNHVSWLDIAAIHAVMPRARFVSRADVMHWPVIGTMVAGAGTLFIERERKRDALRVLKHMTQALAGGQTVAVFPEAQVSDGHALLPFHANLFHAATTTGADVQPLCLRFSDDDGPVSAATYYLGETTLLQSAWRITRSRNIVVTIEVLPAIGVQGMDRRAVADVSRAAIHAALVRHDQRHSDASMAP